ncbi:hypothetical protein DICSQDRAFT_65891 [Dichomitus squalens LYAD-421 SS1]|uniref:Uncharacterized protein n=1 Tax=Dichomitus squalens (strain LYAD-421) TaxID=732165 RepID=R7SSF4_DICSQ|nr:uncharacterized protein DICSQDRAFT_65891 [Dichomitus squalens LYAD-421 SS1]EJF59006.1 hypothetical protein DICSQDRAFT_65891 [Dichomitus squalens LYAD-421 SS1]
MPRSGPPSGPSSLLPTQVAPPSSYYDVDDENTRPPGTQRRKSGLFGSLRGLRLRSPRVSVTSLPATGIASGPASASPRISVYDPSYNPRTSIVRPQSPTLGSLPPRPAFRHDGIAAPERAAPPVPPGAGPMTIGIHARTASGAPIWPGLGPLTGTPAMPSPALTEVSGRAPEGLLNPQWLNAEGMQSQGAISFRDDMDYSRPIGGLVNNRQYSRTTIRSVSTGSSYRHNSLESHQTGDTQMPAPAPAGASATELQVTTQAPFPATPSGETEPFS